MADLLPSLSIGLLPRLGQEPAIDDGFRSWLLKGVYQLQTLNDTSAVELASVDLKKLVRHVAFDFERFALSSRESFIVACSEKEAHNLAGWPLLKLYYSAFFAAHAIMRSQRSGIVKIEKRHAQHLSSIISITSPTSTVLSSGMYVYKTIRSKQNGLPSVILEPAAQSGGVHENFWKLFCDFLNEEAMKASQDSSADAAEFIAGADEISGAIKNGVNGNGVWFSAIRNEMNYQHKHSVWYPFKKGGKALKALTNNNFADSNTFRMDISKKKDPVAAFANTSRYLACLNIEVSDYVAKRSTVGQSFGQKWRRMIDQV